MHTYKQKMIQTYKHTHVGATTVSRATRQCVAVVNGQHGVRPRAHERHGKCGPSQIAARSANLA